eukprot:565923-Prorocentrum_minimum.AAC.1
MKAQYDTHYFRCSSPCYTWGPKPLHWYHSRIGMHTNIRPCRPTYCRHHSRSTLNSLIKSLLVNMTDALDHLRALRRRGVCQRDARSARRGRRRSHTYVLPNVGDGVGYSHIVGGLCIQSRNIISASHTRERPPGCFGCALGWYSWAARCSRGGTGAPTAAAPDAPHSGR